MEKATGKIQDIHERIYRFVIRVIVLTKALKKTSQNMILITQIVKSVTSMGANDQEADAAESRRDFIAKYTIVKKETKETCYWLRVITDTNSDVRHRMNNVQQEGEEILRVVAKIILNSKRQS